MRGFAARLKWYFSSLWGTISEAGGEIQTRFQCQVASTTRKKMAANYYKRISAEQKSLHYASTPTLKAAAGLTGINLPNYSDCDTTSYSSGSDHYACIKRSNSTHYLSTNLSSTNSSCSDDDNDFQLTLKQSDLRAIEVGLRGHKTRLFVCRSMANLYSCPRTSPSAQNVNPQWNLSYTGIPVLLLDLGNTKSRRKRQIQLLLVEKGTCFVLWKDIIDNLTKYQVSPDGLFHTLHLSTDHSRKVGLSFDSEPQAREFYAHLLHLTSDPANISLSGPSRPSSAHSQQEAIHNAIIEEAKRRRGKYKRPDKSDISQPCGFEHLVSVGLHDYTKYFSLQAYVNRMAQISEQTGTKNAQPPMVKYSHGKKNLAPPPPKRNNPVQQLRTTNIQWNNETTTIIICQIEWKKCHRKRYDS